MFICEPTWVSPVQGFEGHAYTEEELKEFATKLDVFTGL